MKSNRLYLALVAACCASGAVQASDFDKWPISAKAGDTTFSLYGNYAYDLNDVRGNSAGLEDSHTNRRKEFGATAKSDGKWDAIVYYDFQTKLWLDVYARVDTRWLFGEDYGKLRAGYSKVPVGFEGVTSSRNDSFLELALPIQAIYEGRRTGVDWALERPTYQLNVGYYFGQDIQGDNDGSTAVVHGAWTPFKAPGNVLHLGASVSIEHPQGSTDGRGIHSDASARWRAKPEMGLTEIRLIDSGALREADSNRREGLEGLWIHGPMSVQAEYLRSHTERNDGLPSFDSSGYYAFGSYVLTGESRGYSGGQVSNIKPAHPWGAVELLARYSELDLNDKALRGGTEHDVTVGANWYLTQHFRLQGNYVWAHADRNGATVDPRILELRAQVYF